MYTRVFHPNRRSYFLFGPRGTGKTTWLEHYYGKKAVFFNLLNPSTFLRFSRSPEVFQEEVEALPKKSIIIIDEIQKLPILLDIVHFFLAQSRNQKTFIMTGSSAQKLKTASANLLAGRASQRYLSPLVFAEHQSLDKVEEILKYGTLPEVLNLKKKNDKIDFLEAYAVTYLREEIQQEAVAKNIDNFSRFLEVAALTNAEITNVSSISRDSGVARTTLKGYFQALEDTLIGHWLHSWRPKQRIKETQHPKFYFFDPGVVRALSGSLRPPLDGIEKGKLFETYFFHELRSWQNYKNKSSKINFWRTPSRVEVDFILEVGNKRIGIELKSSNQWKPEYGKHLKQLKNEGFLDRIYGVYLGEQKRKSQELEIFPLKMFLKLLYEDRV